MIAPLILETWNDPEPPVEMFDRLPREPFRFLLESQGGPTDIARWSFLGHRPFMRFQSRGRKLTLWEAGVTRQWEGGPLEAMETLLAQHAVAASPGLPPFTGGAGGEARLYNPTAKIALVIRPNRHILLASDS